MPFVKAIAEAKLSALELRGLEREIRRFRAATSREPKDGRGAPLDVTFVIIEAEEKVG